MRSLGLIRFFWGLALLGVVRSLFRLQAILPDLAISHWNWLGEADSWAPKYQLLGTLGGSAVLVNSMLAILATPLVQQLPRAMINLPNRDYWLASDERYAEALPRVQLLGSVLGVLINGILLMTMALIEWANSGARSTAPRVPGGPAWVIGILGVGVGLVLWTRRLFRPPSRG